MSTKEDDELRKDLQDDAATLLADAESIEEAVKTSEGVAKIASVASDLFTVFEPFLVGLAQAEGGPIAGKGSKVVGDAIASELASLAAKKNQNPTS